MGSGELTAKARIQRCAISLFGSQGFDVGLRAIASAANVSPALIVSHFGSKEGLRQACDAEVLAKVRERKLEVVNAPPGGQLWELVQDSWDWGELAAYVLTALRQGGDLGNHFFDDMLADAREYLAVGQAAGLIKPSRNPEARALVLTEMAVGALLFRVAREQAANPGASLAEIFNNYHTEATLPLLELYTFGFFTDDRMLQAVLAGEAATTSNPSGADNECD